MGWRKPRACSAHAVRRVAFAAGVAAAPATYCPMPPGVPPPSLHSLCGGDLFSLLSLRHYSACLLKLQPLHCCHGNLPLRRVLCRYRVCPEPGSIAVLVPENSLDGGRTRTPYSWQAVRDLFVAAGVAHGDVWLRLRRTGTRRRLLSAFGGLRCLLHTFFYSATFWFCSFLSRTLRVSLSLLGGGCPLLRYYTASLFCLVTVVSSTGICVFAFVVSHCCVHSPPTRRHRTRCDPAGAA